MQNAWHSKPGDGQSLEQIERGHRGAVGEIDDRVCRGEEDLSPGADRPSGRVCFAQDSGWRVVMGVREDACEERR